MSGSQTMQFVISRCADLQLHDLKQPFGNLLNQNPVELARMPGTPAVVMLAQCLSYLKSNYRFREPMLSDSKSFNNLAGIILNTPVTATPRKDT